MPFRHDCSVEGCGREARYAFDPNLGVTVALRLKSCREHLLGGILASLDYQRQRGDPWISLLVEELPRPSDERRRRWRRMHIR